VFEPNFRLGRGGLSWERVLFYFGLTVALAVLSSCGSSTSTTVTPTITISCTPSSVTLLGTSQCTANVLNLSSTLVNWTVTGTVTGGNFGSITSGGLYTAPGAIPGTNGTANVVTITATSQVQSTLTATQNITLVVPTAINAVTCFDSQNNSASSVSSGNKLQCAATAATGAIVPVNWSVTNTNFPAVTTNLGSISTQGIYTAALVPPPGQSISITATSQALATEKKTATATVVFGNNVLSGPYVFSTSGRLPTHVFWARMGSFSAGGGSIIGGLEDTNQGGSPNTVNNTANNSTPPSPRGFTGSYSVGPDGRGTMQFCEDTNSSCPQGSPATAYFNIVVVSPSQVQMIEFSPPRTSSATAIAGGEMVSQDQSVLTVSPREGILSGTYSFNFAGVSTGATEQSVLGEFTANGHGTISAGASNVPGEIDIDPTPGSPPTLLKGAIYSISSNGRGIMILDGFTFSLYPISANRAKFIEIDAPTPPATTPDSVLLGDAYLQQTSSTCGWGLNALSGSVVFQVSGMNTSGGLPGVVIGDVGTFTADGTAGVVSGATIDENSGGTVSSQTGSVSDNYTMDSCGRGTLSIGSHSYVYYIVSPSDAVLQETSSGINSHGLLVPSQGGPFVDATLTGSYALRVGGTDAAGTAGKLENFVGQLTSGGTGMNLAGTLDLNDFGATQTPVAIASGTYVHPLSGGIRATMSLPLNTTPSPTTRNFVLYQVGPKLFYVLDSDPAPSGTAIGFIVNQF
jgi:hypothetical protein